MSELLSGYKLELIDLDSESCGRSVIPKAVVNLHTELVSPILSNRSPCLVGIIGLYCSIVTNTLAPIISHPGIDYVKMAASTSHEHRHDPTFRDIFHTIASSRVLHEAVIKMMMTFNWRRIGLIYDALGFYHQTTSNDFAHSAASLSNIELILQVPIVISGQSSYLERFITDGITDTFNIINNQEVRISYWSITEDESSFLFCEVFKEIIFGPDMCTSFKKAP